MQNIFRILGFFLALCFLGDPCPAQDIPRRIISLAPSLTRQIYDLKQQDRLVGITSYCPRYAQGKEVIGSLTLLNFEKISSLQPDLILASTDCNKKNDIRKLQSLGMKVEVFEGCESFACMCSEFTRLGALLGREKESLRIIAEIRMRLEDMLARISRQPELKVFWQMGTNPLVTASDKTFTGEMIRLAGCRNIFGGLKAKYPRINIETVLTGNPDVIFIVSHMDGSKNQHKAWQPFQEIGAVKKGRVYVVSADLVCQPTPGMFIMAFREIVSRLYPGVI